MSKVDKTKKDGKKGVLAREIAGILLMGFSIFSLIALHIDTAGWVGRSIRVGLKVLFGDLSVVFSLILFLFALHLFREKKLLSSNRKIFGFVLLMLSLTLLFHMLYYREYQFPPMLKEELIYGKQGEGAGILGALLLVFSYNAFGIQGSYVLLATAILIGIIFLFEVSILSLIKRISHSMTSLFTHAWHKAKDERNEKRRERKQILAERKQVKKKRVLKDEKYASNEKENENIIIDKRQPKEVVEKPNNVLKESSTKNAKSASESHKLPPAFLLKKSGARDKGSGGVQKDLLEETFASFGIEAKVVNVSQGPVVTRYELQPAPGIKVSRITALADDLALSLAAENVRIEAPVPGKPVVGIEVPNKTTEPVLFRDVLESSELQNHESPVALALGKDIAGNPVIADLKKWLHVLVAGATGSGKSVCLNSMIASILFRADPEQVKLLMIDPKRVELSVYAGIPHLVSPVVTDPRKAAVALRWAVTEMERRYQLFADAGVRNIDTYLKYAQSKDLEETPEHLPYIVIIVDELSDLMMISAAEVEDAICRLAQMARAAGMYLIIATQRPSVDVITGLIKANVPSRISFAVSSQVDSRTILDMGGAERLIGKGDMLYYPIGATKPIRAQGAWISDKEVESIVKFWKKQGEPIYEEAIENETISIAHEQEEEDDELLPDAIRLVIENGQASISMLQRRFRIGYSRAARLIDVMEVRGIVGTHQGSKPREVLADITILEEV